MSTVRSQSSSATAGVPLLDVNRQNHPLAEEFSAAIHEVISSGAFVLGPACNRLEAALAQYSGTEHAVGCASGSDALLLALMVLDVGPGDEVILPSFTFFATAGAVHRLGATPVFADIDPVDFNMDPADVAKKMTPRTKVVLPVHLFGTCAPMEPLCELAQAHDAVVVEDAAQSIGAERNGRRAGSMGCLGAFSFYPTKNLGGFGDGGMITTDDPRLVEKIRVLRNHGQQPRYYHSLVGINSRLDSLQAAVLEIKLKHLEGWIARRAENAAHYHDLFRAAGLADVIQLPRQAAGHRHVWNQFTIRVPDGHRDGLQKFLNEKQIGAAIYYPVGLHRQPCFADLGYRPGSLPVTEAACDEVLSLPIFPELTDEEQMRVVETIAAYARRHGLQPAVESSARQTAARREAA